MKSFKDNDGRLWEIVVNVDTVKRVRRLIDVDLMEVAGGQLLERLAGDPILLCDVIYAVCKPQADSQGITDEQFGSSMGGDVIDVATAALLESLADFFPSRKRQVLNQAFEKMRQIETMALDRTTARLASPQMDAEIIKALDQLDSTNGSSSTNSPESSESIPAP